MELELRSKQILLYDGVVDFRKSIDGLSLLVSEELKQSDHEMIFLFFNRRRDKVKVLAWHGNGYILLYKRLERGRFHLSQQSGKVVLDNRQLSWLLAGLDWEMMGNWKQLGYDDFF
jgi:transposase